MTFELIGITNNGLKKMQLDRIPKNSKWNSTDLLTQALRGFHFVTQASNSCHKQSGKVSLSGFLILTFPPSCSPSPTPLPLSLSPPLGHI